MSSPSPVPSIKAVICDWAGTVIDHGSRAPMGAFVRAFAEFGITISINDARGPMGMAKRDHIRLVTQVPSVDAAWRAKYGKSAADADFDAILKVFEPMTIEAVKAHADFIPGGLEALAVLRARGIRVGSTTGYTRPIMAVLQPIAEAGGYKPDITVCAGDLPEGRPAPLMMWHAMSALGVWPAFCVVKVDDTPPGIGEGRNAGAWTVGVMLTGNFGGLSAEELAVASEGDKEAIRSRARAEMGDADVLVDSIADLPSAVAEIESRLAKGGRPRGPVIV